MNNIGRLRTTSQRPTQRTSPAGRPSTNSLRTMSSIDSIGIVNRCDNQPRDVPVRMPSFDLARAGR